VSESRLHLFDRLYGRSPAEDDLAVLRAENKVISIALDRLVFPAHTEYADPDRSAHIVALLDAKMAEASRSMSEYLGRQLYPPAPPWYVRVWRRLTAAWSVLIGRQYAVTEAVAFHECPIEEDEE
jgi:hypothetical protein